MRMTVLSLQSGQWTPMGSRFSEKATSSHNGRRKVRRQSEAGVCGGRCLCSLGRRRGRERSLRCREHEGWQGSCKTFSVFCPLFSCTSLSSGLFTLNSKVWFGSGQPEPSQTRRKSSPGCRSLKDTTFSNSPRCLCAISYHLIIQKEFQYDIFSTRSRLTVLVFFFFFL